MMVATLDRDTQRHLTHVERAVRAEFDEMPGMQLTFAQVRRLFGLTPEDCDAVLRRLMAARFLAQDPEGRYIRR